MDGFTARCYDSVREESVVLFDPRPVGGFALVVLPDAYANLWCLGATSSADALQDRGLLYVLPSARPELLPIIMWKLLASPSTLADSESSPSPSPSEAGETEPSPQPATVAGLPNLFPRVPAAMFFPWDPVPKPRALIKVKALAVLHGGIQTFRVTLPGDLVVFTTRDGNLYQYTPFAPRVCEIRTNRDVGQGRAAFPALEPVIGRYLAWEDFELKQVYVMDRLTGQIQPIPTLDLLVDQTLDEVAAIAPSFVGLDPNHLFLVVIRRDGSFREYAYDIRTGVTRGLAVLNAFLAAVTPVATSSATPSMTPTDDDLLNGVCF